MTLAFIATSRTGSNPRIHELYEIALIEHGGGQPDRRSVWRLKPQRMPDADPAELARTGFHQRRHYGHDAVHIDPDLQTAMPVEPGALAAELSARTFGLAVMTLDLRETAFLGRFLESHRALAGWSRTVDLASCMQAYLQGMRAGWLAASHHAERHLGDPDLDYAVAYEQPPNAYRLAQAMRVGGEEVGEGSDALARATLALRMYTTAASLPAPPPPPPPAPGPAAGADTGDRLVAPVPAAEETLALTASDATR